MSTIKRIILVTPNIINRVKEANIHDLNREEYLVKMWVASGVYPALSMVLCEERWNYSITESEEVIGWTEAQYLEALKSKS